MAARYSVKEITERKQRAGAPSSDDLDWVRQGAAATPDELRWLMSGAADGTIPDEALVDWIAAVAYVGMDLPELAAYTQAMAESGRVFKFRERTGKPVAVKHAPGGVGENTSGAVDALVAACGVAAPAITGPRLMHTPGTVERYGSIPNFCVTPDADQFERFVESAGAAIIAQSADIVPADGRIYALREQRGLVQVQAHILASVLSKKIACSPDVIALLMTYGDGALLRTKDEAEEMARLMIAVCSELDIHVGAVLCNMDRPLGNHLATTSLAVQESAGVVAGWHPSSDLSEAVLRLASIMIHGAGKANSIATARRIAEHAIATGSALASFKLMLETQGANPSIVGDPTRWPKAEHQIALRAPRAGWVVQHARALGDFANELAGAWGSAQFDPAAGIVLDPSALKGPVTAGRLLATVHASGELGARMMAEEEFRAEVVRRCFTVADTQQPEFHRFTGLILSDGLCVRAT